MLSFSFKTVCYVKSNVHCYLTTGLYISHVLVCHKTTLKPPRSPLLQNNVISHTNQNLEQTTSSENSIIVFSQVHIFVRKFLNPGVLFLLQSNYIFVTFPSFTFLPGFARAVFSHQSRGLLLFLIYSLQGLNSRRIHVYPASRLIVNVLYILCPIAYRYEGSHIHLTTPSYFFPYVLDHPRTWN